MFSSPNDRSRRLLKYFKNPLFLAIVGQALLISGTLFVGVILPEPKKEKVFKPTQTGPKQSDQLPESFSKMRSMDQLSPSTEAWESLANETSSLLPSPEPAPNITTPIPAFASLASTNFFQEALSGLNQFDQVQPDFELDPTVEFMGMKTTGKRILFLMDISSSVKNKIEKSGWKMTRIREEVSQSIDQFGPGQLFNIVQFSRKWETFADQSIPATLKSKAKANNWLQTSFRTTGTSRASWQKSNNGDGFLNLLQMAFALEPAVDVLIVVSDGDFQQSLPRGEGRDIDWKDIETIIEGFTDRRPTPLQIQFIGFHVKEHHQKAIQQIIAKNQGSLKVISKN